MGVLAAASPSMTGSGAGRTHLRLRFGVVGACSNSAAIEKALRVRCSRIHEDEKRGGYKTYEDKGRSYKPRGQQFFKKKVIVKKARGAHLPDGEEPRGGEEEAEELRRHGAGLMGHLF